MNTSKKQPVGKRFDKAVIRVKKKIGKSKAKIIGVKEDIADAAHDIGKSMKKTVRVYGSAFPGLKHKR